MSFRRSPIVIPTKEESFNGQTEFFKEQLIYIWNFKLFKNVFANLLRKPLDFYSRFPGDPSFGGMTTHMSSRRTRDPLLFCRGFLLRRNYMRSRKDKRGRTNKLCLSDWRQPGGRENFECKQPSLANTNIQN